MAISNILALVAQRIEQQFPKLRVGSSSLPKGTKATYIFSII